MPSYTVDQKQAIAEVVEITGLTDSQAAKVCVRFVDFLAFLLSTQILVLSFSSDIYLANVQTDVFL